MKTPVKKRIIILFIIDAMMVGGTEQQLLELIRLMDKTLFEPIVLTLYSGGPMEHEYKAVPKVELLSINRKGKYDFFCIFNIIRILKSKKVDIIQTYLTPASLFGLLAAFICRTPVKIMTRRPGTGGKADSMGYRFYYKAEAFLGRFIDWVIPNSRVGKDYMLSKGVCIERIKLIPNGVNTARLIENSMPMQEARVEIGLNIHSKVVGTIARLDPYKNHALLFQAASKILKVLPNTKFILVGDGVLRKSLVNLAEELGIASAVIFFGEQRNVGVYLSAIDIAVLPSWQEGSSNFILEAMAIGKPVVATDIVGNRDLVRDNETGFLVPNYDAEVMSDTIIKLLVDHEMAQKVGQRAKEVATTEFSLDRMVQAYQSLWEETFQKKRLPYLIK